MSDKEHQKTSADEGAVEEEAADRPLWEYLERAERQSNEPMFYELAETLSGSSFEASGSDFVN